MYQFLYDYVKPKHGEKAKLYYVDIVMRFIVSIKRDDIYKVIAEDVQTRFNTSKCELHRPLSKVKIEKVIRLMKDKLSWKMTIKFIELQAKTSKYLIDDSSEDKKAKDTKKCVIKIKLKVENYRNLTW